MTKKSSKRNYKQHTAAVAPAPVPAKPRASWAKRLPAGTPMALFFVLVWVFGWWVYGPVLRACQENSFFAFDAVLMKHFSQMSLGWLRLPARLLLCTFHYPALGSLVLALMLTGFCHFACYAMGPKARWFRLLPFVLSFAWLLYMVLLGFNIFYQSEASLLFMVVLVALVVSLLAALVRWVACKGHGAPPEAAPRQVLWGSVVVLLLGLALNVYALVGNSNIIKGMRLQHMVELGEFEQAIDLARTCSHPNRCVAAYHAMALSQMGSLPNGLFDLYYNYPAEKVRNAGGNYDDAITIYSVDGDYYAGLAQSSYHTAMERMVIDGPTVFMIKRLCRAALMMGERNVVRKYAYILSLVPFEGQTARNFMQMVDNPQLMAQDLTYSRVAPLQPLNDAFEQSFRTPLFIGYNVSLTNFRSLQALNNSITACLYAKQLPKAFERAQLLAGGMLPPAVEQAARLQSYTHPELRQIFHLSQNSMDQQNIGRFASLAQPYFDKREEGARALREEWLSFYPYYYFFENLPPKERIDYQQLEKGGVN